MNEINGRFFFLGSFRSFTTIQFLFSYFVCVASHLHVRATVLRDKPHPESRVPDEGHGREVKAAAAAEERPKPAPDESHVVVQRKPRHHHLS